MKSSAARALALFASSLCVSCGPPPAPERAPAPPLAIGPAAAPQTVPQTRSEVRPAAPEDLGLVLRLSDPEQLAKDVVSVLPPSAASASLDPVQLATLALGRKLGNLVDLAQPIDIAVNGDSSFVASIAVKQDAEAKLGDGLVLREEGSLLVVGKPEDGASDLGRMSACAFTSAAGRAPTRLVCASDEASLKASAAYLARNVAAEPVDADARVTLPGKVFRDKKDATARAIGDAASARLGAALVESFLDEIERVDVSVKFAGANVGLGADLRLSARESMLARAIVPRTTPAPPPRSFYRLPGDALFALHTTGALADDLAPLRTALAENVEGTLVQDGYRADKTRELRERLESLLLTGGPFVVGGGVAGGREGAEKALAALDGAATPAEQSRAEAKARGALARWVMIAVEEPAEKWTTALRDIVRRGQDADKTRRPGSTSSTPRDPDGDHVDLRIGTLDPALKLPKDALHVEVLIAPRTKGKRPTRTAHVFVVPKGATTWLGYSEDAPAIASRLRLSTDESTDAGTLARSTEATSLRARPAIGAGLFSLAGIGHFAASTTTADDLRRAAKTATRSASLGPRGNQTLTWVASADAKSSGARLSVQIDVTRQTATDVLRLLGM